MASPTYTPPTPGNLIASVALPFSANIGVYLNYTAKIEGQVTARVSTSGTATANTYTKHEAYAVYGSTAVSGGALLVGTTSVAVSSTVGMATGQIIYIENEKVTISNIAGNVLILAAATLYAHALAAPIYLAERDPTYPGTQSMGGTARTTYAKTSYLSTGQWFFLLTNTDTGQGVIVELSAATIDGIV
jgi:hypothetical protein